MARFVVVVEVAVIFELTVAAVDSVVVDAALAVTCVVAVAEVVNVMDEVALADTCVAAVDEVLKVIVDAAFAVILPPPLGAYSHPNGAASVRLVKSVASQPNG